MKINDDDVTFSSGHTLYANLGIIGLSPDLDITHGYDGGIDWPPYEATNYHLTSADMRELADHMIKQWKAFKAQLPP
jgi:hypothetical protein